VEWVIINELQPNAVRASGSSLAGFGVWALCAAVNWVFPAVARASGALVFGFFALMMVARFILEAKFLPETKGISLEQMERHLKNAK
jgi:hypothetical protein